MNQLTILSNTVVAMSSREVAALCEKRHVLRDIEMQLTRKWAPQNWGGVKEKPLARTRGKLSFFQKEF